MRNAEELKRPVKKVYELTRDLGLREVRMEHMNRNGTHESICDFVYSRDL